MTQPVPNGPGSVNHGNDKIEPLRATIRCPRCNSDVHYKYGKTPSGRERFLCLACNRQFVLAPQRQEIKNRPQCPTCGTPMHVYKKEETLIRFRCANYPQCKTFVKVDREDT